MSPAALHPRRTPYLSSEVIRDAQLRLSRIAGHVGGIHRMLADERDCTEILRQLIAVRAALTQVNVHLMESHVEACLSAIESPADQQQALDRLQAALSAALREEK